MRTYLVVLLSLGLGVGLGMGSTWARYHRPAAPGLAAPGEPQPRLVVDAIEHHFGLVRAETLASHDFRVRNAGQAPLTLEAGGSTCASCTVGRIAKGRLLPGEETAVTIEYHAGPNSLAFRKAAFVHTNDPAYRPLALTISGRVAPRCEAAPAEVAFSRTADDGPQSSDLRLLAYFDDHLEVGRYEWADPAVAPYFDVQLKPLGGEDVKRAGARGGQLLTLVVRPGLPAGTTITRLTLVTDLQASKIELPVRVDVTSNLEIVGSGWNQQENLLTLGTVRRAEGLRRTLYLVLRGDDRRQAQFALAAVKPDWLKVSVGPPTAFGQGSAVRVPLTVEVPAGSPASNFLGAEPSRWASIELRADGLGARQVKLWTKFSVED